MQSRDMGRTGVQVSALGLGCMRLPMVAGGDAIDEAHAIEMIRWAIDHGLNYLDTAYGYHGGQSEVVVGKALQDGYRARTAVATKMPCWQVKTADDLDRLFNEQLARLQTTTVDYYLLHSLNKANWATVQRVGALDWLHAQQAAGRIGQIGFSFHDELRLFKTIVDAFDWAFCQIQYNYLNEEEQAGTEGLTYAAARGLGVIVMEPLLGGKLVRLPGNVTDILRYEAPGVAAVELALNWLWDKPEVSMVLSGMSSLAQVKENMALADKATPGMLGEAGRRVVAHAQEAFAALTPIPCTRCGYCEPCPQGVAIPANFSLYNDSKLFDTTPAARRQYGRMQPAKRAEACIACRECEARCPQSILISEWMPKVHAYLATLPA